MLLLATAPLHARPSIEDFARRDIVTFAKLSPDGKYLAMSGMVDKAPGLLVERLEDHKITAKVSAGTERGIYDAWWASSERLVVTLYQTVGPLAQPALTGEMIGLNADYSGIAYLFGFRGNTDKLGFLTTERPDGYAVMIDPLPDDPTHVLIAAPVRKNRPQELIKLNVNDGTRQSLGEIPLLGTFSVVTDRSGAARYVSVTKEDWSSVSFTRKNDESEWQKFESRGADELDVTAFAFTQDGSGLYELRRQDQTSGGRLCLAAENIATRKQTILNCDDDAELGHPVFSFDGSVPIAVSYEMDRPTIKPLIADHPDLLTLQRLGKTFPDDSVRRASSTRDGSKIVILVHGDRNPGDYYLYDTKTAKAEYVMSGRDWIKPEQMAHREPIHFVARDGTILHGYLTRPPGIDGPVPLIVNPHGGPVGIADDWYWDDDAQLLATHGYAVLQVNIRGSGGRGESFERLGRRSWATTLIDDITDGAHWAIEQKITESGHLCIYGASYGGYAALMSAEREPELYRCAVGYAGVYDLNQLQTDADFVESTGGRRAFRELIGDDERELRKASPITYVDQIKASLFIIHGFKDPRAPYTQAEALMAALDARRYPYEKLTRLHEIHGFYSFEDRTELYTRLLDFLNRKLPPAH